MEFNNNISDALISIGKNVKKLRLKKEYTQQDLAFYSECERCTISNIERFNCEGINLKTLIKISIVLEVNLEELFK